MKFKNFDVRRDENPYFLTIFFENSNQGCINTKDVYAIDTFKVFKVEPHPDFARTEVYHPDFSNNDSLQSEYITSVILESYTTDDKEVNYSKLKEFSEFKNNWNGHGAVSFSDYLLRKVRNILDSVSIQPEMFPTANNSIQLEYDNSKGDYLEFEIFDNEIKKFFYGSDNSTETTIVNCISDINSIVLKFYE